MSPRENEPDAMDLIDEPVVDHRRGLTNSTGACGCRVSYPDPAASYGKVSWEPSTTRSVDRTGAHRLERLHGRSRPAAASRAGRNASDQDPSGEPRHETPEALGDRVLASILFTDIVGSTEQLVRLGDAKWRVRLDRHAELVEAGLRHFRGRLVKTTGDGIVAIFNSPARGVNAARWILHALAEEGLNARAGMHVGEIEHHRGDIAGLAVHLAAHVMGRAGCDELLVSRTVCDLTAGSGLQFEERGSHRLKGVPGDWQLFALA